VSRKTSTVGTKGITSVFRNYFPIIIVSCLPKFIKLAVEFPQIGNYNSCFDEMQAKKTDGATVSVAALSDSEQQDETM
jgi:hypothetical protein